MRAALSKILVVDLECTCWEGKPPAGQESEIIEIGVCLLDTVTLERSAKRSIMVKPVRSEISAFCTSLTTITPEDVQDGVSFEEALRILTTDYNSKNQVWASFGDYDRKQFDRQCKSFGLKYPFGDTHLNVKTIAALMLGLNYAIGMEGILEKLNLPLEGTHHRGADDAWNIALILKYIIQKWRN